MHISIYIYIYIYLYIYIYVLYTYIYLPLSLSIYIYIYLHLSLSIYIYTHIYTSLSLSLYIYIYYEIGTVLIISIRKVSIRGSQIPEPMLMLTSTCPLECSNLPGARRIFPDRTFENWPYRFGSNPRMSPFSDDQIIIETRISGKAAYWLRWDL